LKEILVPMVNINDEYVRVVEVFFNNGDKVQKGDLLAEIESTKASQELFAEDNGIILLKAQSGDELRVGQPLALLFESDSEYHDYLVSQSNTDTNDAQENVLATKKAIDLAKRLSVDIKNIKPQGRIIKGKDVLNFFEAASIKEQLSRFDFPKAGFLSNKNLEEQFEFIKQMNQKEKIDFYIKSGAKVGKDIILGKGVVIVADQIVIEDNARILENTTIRAKRVFIGKNALIGEGVSVNIKDFFLGKNSLVGDSSFLGGGDAFGPAAGIFIADNCFVGRESLLDAGDGIYMLEHSCLSPRVMAFTHSHWQDYLKGYSPSFGKIIIGKDSHTGAGALIAPGTQIGEGAFVMANSLVAKDIPAFEIWGGVPAVRHSKVSIISSLSDQEHRFQMLYPKLLEDISSRGFDVSNIYYEPRCDLSDVKEDSIVLAFDCKKDLDMPENTCIFLLDERKIVGTIDEKAYAVKNFLRRRGIKFLD